jgi:3-deoxy-7-phosphoheptulonate synthase
MQQKVDDLRIRDIKELSPPSHLLREFPIGEKASETVHAARRAIHAILHGKEERLLVIVGPCSIHDPSAARDYARRLMVERLRFADELEIVMRVYFEKPRTTVGWKGLINDPDLDGSFKINKGLRIARELLLDINGMGLPAGTEYLDMITPQYIADLVSWGAIGARTTESQVHRELASGLSCPVGFKNGTDGNLRIALEAVHAASQPHHFLSVTKAGHSAIVATSGNEDCHIILRGGRQPNYDRESVAAADREAQLAGLPCRLMVDASHGNSLKRPENQIGVVAAVAAQLGAGDRRLFGMMIESQLVAGRQDLVRGQPLAYGQSITDGCAGWPETIEMLEVLAEAVRQRSSVASAANVRRVVAAGRGE